MRRGLSNLKRIFTAIVAIAAMACAGPAADAAPRYPWRGDVPATATLAERVPPPPGFARVPVEVGSFAAWLRALPVKPAQTPVRLYDGRPKWNQQNHVAVIDIDTGTRDLQQCADAIMRLRAEYLLGSGRARDIAFNTTNGKRQPFTGNAGDYRGFRRYMDRVFAVAGSYSLEREMRPAELSAMRIGDVFIKGGFPGHAVLVVDMAADERSGEKRFLLLQSYMPAQDMHVLTAPRSPDGTPWYVMPGEKDELITPEWIFPPGALHRFRN